MTFCCRISIAASRAIALVGLISSVTVRLRSVWRISVAPDVTSTRARERTGTILPDDVTTGMLSIPWVVRMARFGPVSVKSVRRPPIVTSATRNPSLKASMVAASSRALTPASSSRVRSGTTLTSGAPRLRPGRGRI